jgi:hypothetical protein
LVSESVKKRLSWSKNRQLGAAVQIGLEHGSREIATVRSRYQETSSNRLRTLVSVLGDF